MQFLAAGGVLSALRGAVSLGVLCFVTMTVQAQEPPHLDEKGTATQLVVDGEPFLMFGGEVGNSTASSLGYMEPIWPKLEKMNLNTVLAPVYWELIEPQEGNFDFSLVDVLIEEARARDMRLVLLWFGSWKNSMSSYVPEWVKRDQDRFPRAERPNGTGMEILSPFSEANVKADARAFEALMDHLREVDGQQHTVVMVQIENEIGMIPEARDHRAVARRQYENEVPARLLDYLQAHRETLRPALKKRWAVNGYRPSGTWEEVFGEGVKTEELFTAWHFARYVEQVASAGEEAYDLPMYVNAALWEPGEDPGEYPSGGPLPSLMDVWRAGAPTLDFFAPDIYFPNYAEWATRFTVSGNPLFVPEAKRAGAETSGANALYTFGAHDALGHSPFSIEDAPVDGPLSSAYEILHQLAPLVKKYQGTDSMTAVRPPLAFDGSLEETSQTVSMGDYVFDVTFVDPWTPRNEQVLRSHGGLIIQTDENEFFVGGSGVTITFDVYGADTTRAGIARIEDGRFADGRWKRRRVLNGDQSHQGRHLRLPPDEFGIQYLKLYQYH